MSRPTAKRDLDDNLPFQRREWRVQRIGWWMLVAFVLAAALGLFGGGPFSSAVARDAAGHAHVEYERFLRSSTPNRIAIHSTGARPGAAGEMEIQIDRAYFDAVRLVRILPAPHDTSIGPETVTLRFGPMSPGPLTIVIDIEPQRVGRLTSRIRVTPGGAVVIRQFVYF